MSVCPSAALLRQLLDEQLPADHQAAVMGHVETCGVCQTMLEELTSCAGAAPSLHVGEFAILSPFGQTGACAEHDGRELRPLRHLLPDAPASLPFDCPRPGTDAERGWPTIPGYEIEERVGMGGMGVVYKALQVGLNRLVALKMVHAADQGTPEQLLRLRAEGEMLARLRHPNIVQVYEVGSFHQHLYLVMEWAPGGSLEKVLRGRRVSARDAAALVEKLARAIHHAHEQGIVHRDLKPANILLQIADCSDKSAICNLQSAIPKIADFGLAKQLHAHLHLTQPDALAGTPRYMTPEQVLAQHERVGPTTDIFALGVILYEALTGRPPFMGECALEIMSQVVESDPPPPSSLVPGLPRDLDAIVRKALEREPSCRYPTAWEFAEDLRRFNDGVPVLARSKSLLLRMASRLQRARRVLTAVVLVALLLSSSIVFFQLGRLTERYSQAGEKRTAPSESTLRPRR